MKKIIIKCCLECPHVGHRGAFGKIAYIPRCEKTNQTIPYTTYIPRAYTNKIHAKIKGDIPSFCPLENN